MPTEMDARLFKRKGKRTILRGKYSSWREVMNGVPQGSWLLPIMFLVYINDMNDNIGTASYLNMFADDAKCREQ